MNPHSLLKIATLSTILLASAAQAGSGPKRSSDSIPHASDKSQGLPNADGHKPGKGKGYGHLKGKGKGHGWAFGHGHDDDKPDSPG